VKKILRVLALPTEPEAIEKLNKNPKFIKNSKFCNGLADLNQTLGADGGEYAEQDGKRKSRKCPKMGSGGSIQIWDFWDFP
jgi:hypothetical protein